MLPKLKRCFNLFEDVLVLIVAGGGGGGGGEKEYFTFIFFLALPTSCFPPYKRTSSTTLRQNLNDEIVLTNQPCVTALNPPLPGEE